MTTPNDRMKKVRIVLNLTQDELGKLLGVTKAAISRIERGDRKLTEQMALAICRELNVYYFYLMEGKGEMFQEIPDTLIEEICEEYNLDDIDKKIVEKYLNLKADQRDVIKHYLKSIFL